MKKNNTIEPMVLNNEHLISPFERLVKESNNSQEAHRRIEKMLSDSKESLFTALNKV